MVPNGVLIYDSRLGKVTFANRDMADIVGTVDLEGIERRLTSVRAATISGEDSASQSCIAATGGTEKQRQNLWQYIQSENFERASDQDLNIFKSKDTKRYMQVKTSPIMESSQVLVFCVDITRVKEIELLTQGQKLRSTFFSSVAHELRTPLNSIIPLVRLILVLLTAGPSPPLDRIKVNLGLVLNSALHLESLVEDALDMSRIENNKFTLNPHLFDIRKAINEVCDIMRFQLEQKGLYLRVNVEEGVPRELMADSKRVKQVLFNLIGNAVKFTFRGGVCVRVGRNDRGIGFEVEDTGVGIKQEDLSRLF